MSLVLPFVLPEANTTGLALDQDTGSYDLMLGGVGFRFATSPQMPYKRYTEPTTVRRFDNSAEPGEQTLSPLPWIKSQSSFHAGAGQLNLEQGLSQFQYQQEEVAHIRFESSLGIDPWSVGEVKRLPDVTVVSGSSLQRMVTGHATTGGEAVVAASNTAVWLYQFASDPTSAPPTPVAVTLDLAGDTSLSSVIDLCSNGLSYFVIYKTNASIIVAKGNFDSTTVSVLYKVAGSTTQAVIGWSKERLMAAFDGSIYELDSNAAALTAWPAAKYTHPAGTAAKYTCISESPTGILVALSLSGQSNIIQLTLDSSGATPTLAGASTVAKLPPGEIVYTLDSYLGSFLGVGTTKGVRIGTFDTYTGALTYGPLTIETTQPVLDMVGRDRFIFAGYTNQQADGSTGLVRIDLSMKVDVGGRNAWAADLRPPTTAATRQGIVQAVSLLPATQRLVWISDDGLHIEGIGPGVDGEAWLKTSRIRYDTAEPKLFTVGRFHGNLDTESFRLGVYLPATEALDDLGPFGPIGGSDSRVEFGMPSILSEWVQLRFVLVSQNAVLNSYQTKAVPAPLRQHIIQFSVNCFREEVDRYGMVVTDPDSPRTRYQKVRDIEALGGQIRFTEFTNEGAVTELVVIDQLEFDSDSTPSIQDDFGGTISFKLRAVK